MHTPINYYDSTKYKVTAVRLADSWHITSYLAIYEYIKDFTNSFLRKEILYGIFYTNTLLVVLVVYVFYLANIWRSQFSSLQQTILYLYYHLYFPFPESKYQCLVAQTFSLFYNNTSTNWSQKKHDDLNNNAIIIYRGLMLASDENVT